MPCFQGFEGAVVFTMRVKAASAGCRSGTPRIELSFGDFAALRGICARPISAWPSEFKGAHFGFRSPHCLSPVEWLDENNEHGLVTLVAAAIKAEERLLIKQ